MDQRTGEIKELAKIENLEHVTELNAFEMNAIKDIKPSEKRPEALAWLRFKGTSTTPVWEELSKKDIFLAGYRRAKEDLK